MLQAALKRSCSSLLQFSRRDFETLAQVDPALAQACASLDPACVAESIQRFETRLKTLASRIEEKEKLRVVFIGPCKAGKSTLVNILLSANLKKTESFLPVDNVAATSRVWAVESSGGHKVEVLLEDELLTSWDCSDVSEEEAAGIRAKLVEFLEDHLGRSACPTGHERVRVVVPLSLLNPFGCHYCLVDTPGFTESEEYQAMVLRYLQDHSHISCMVCPLTEGLALPQGTRNMLKRSYSRTFWVLSRYDYLMQQRSKSRSKRENAEKAVEKFTEEIQGVDPQVKIFRHAGQLLLDGEEDDEGSGFLLLPPAELGLEEVRQWCAEIRAHVQECFMAIQQEQHILISQTRACIECAADILQEYFRLKDGAQGTLAANEYYLKELQEGAEDAAQKLDLEVKHAVDQVKNQELSTICATASTRLQSGGTYGSQQSFFDALLQEVIPDVQTALKDRLEEVVRRGQERVLDLARRLLQAAGVPWEQRSPSHEQHEVLRPDSAHLAARYPLESFITLSAAAGTGGCAVLSQTGATLLAQFGVRLGAMSVAGVVGAAVVTVAGLGLAVKHASQYQPFWKYATVQADVVERLRQANHWGVLAEAASSRARAQLLAGVASFRFTFSQVLLTRGMPREVLISIIPDFPLFEEIHRKLEGTRGSIQAFVDAEDLSVKAGKDVEICAEDAAKRCWAPVIDLTAPYVAPNAHTDSVEGEVLARLLYLRCEALVRSQMFGEAAHSGRVFREVFPELAVPRVCQVAAEILHQGLSGGAAMEELRAEAADCQRRMEEASCSSAGEVPALLELWFRAVVASWLPEEQDDQVVSLTKVISFVLLNTVQDKPWWEDAVEVVASTWMARLASSCTEVPADFLTMMGTVRSLGPTPDDEGRSSGWDKYHGEALHIYQQRCEVFRASIVDCVHMIWAALPAHQISMQLLGDRILEHTMAEVSCLVTKDWQTPGDQRRSFADIDIQMEERIRMDLCHMSSKHDVCEEWLTLLRSKLQGAHAGASEGPGAAGAAASVTEATVPAADEAVG